MQSRRFFLKNGLAVIGLAGLAKVPGAAASSPASKWAMIIDVNRCTGCQSCVIACKAQNKTAADRFNTRVLSLEDGNFPEARVIFTPVQCNHCENPRCVPACPLEATYKLPNGIVVTRSRGATGTREPSRASTRSRSMSPSTSRSTSRTSTRNT